MSLRRRQREHTIEVILDAATEVFAERGYAGTSMEDIARRVGSAPATLYGYFKGKAQIFARILADRSEAYLDELEARLDEADDFRGALTGLFDHVHRWTGQNSEFMRLLIAVMRSHGHGAMPERAQADAHEQRYFGLVTGLVQRGLDEGVLRPGPAPALAVSLIGLVHTNIYAWLVAQAGSDDPDFPSPPPGAPPAGDLGDLMQFVHALFLQGAAERTDR